MGQQFLRITLGLYTVLNGNLLKQEYDNENRLMPSEEEEREIYRMS